MRASRELLASQIMTSFWELGYFRSSKPILPSLMAAEFMVFAATIYCEALDFHGYCETGERRMRIGWVIML